MARGPLIPGLRDGRTVDLYWNYSFTPVLLEDGQVGGVLVVATETTSRMVASRRQAALHQGLVGGLGFVAFPQHFIRLVGPAKAQQLDLGHGVAQLARLEHARGQ